jgi:phage baseplate assembly protein W
MAQRIANKFTLDTQQKGIGISLNFSGNGVFNSTYSTKDQVKANLINYFLTNKGERVMAPDYGANLRAELFEHINSKTYDVLKSKIEEGIKINFPSVSVSNIEILGNEDYNAINVTIKYNIIPFGVNDQLNLTFR